MFPVEILEHIVDYLHNDSRSLAACALAGRPLLQSSRFHRFNGRSLTYMRAVLLEPLLAASPALASSIASLSYQPFNRSYSYSESIEMPKTFTFLRLLPNLIDLEIPAKALSYVAHLGPQLVYLRVFDVRAETSQGLLAGLSLFPTLQELELSDTYSVSSSIPCSVQNSQDLPAPHVRKLSFRETACVELISRWFRSHERTPHLHSFMQTIRDPDDAHIFVEQSRTLGPLAQELEVLFKPDGSMRDALEKANLTLYPYSALQSCALRFALPEMCVAENQSLAWIPTIIGQLSSSSIRSLTISLVVDNVEDLRSLNSECAVRVLTSAYFDDMWVLDWAAIEQALSADRLGGLTRLVVEGRGDRASLEEHIRITCPGLHDRRILSLVAVAKSATWAD